MRATVLAIVALGLTTGFGADSYDALLRHFDYDRAAPLDVREAGVQDRSGVHVHALNARARRDRLEFLQTELRLGPIDWEAVARVPQLVQPPPAARPADVNNQNAIIGALYDVISGPGGQKRNWDRFRSLFAPGARLIPTGRRPDGSGTMRVLTPDEYASGIGPRLEEGGFFEREVARTSEEFGDIVQAFSTYESRHAAGDSQPFARGINSIQLVNDGTRWWVITVLWDSERPDNPIPARYLKKGGS